MSSVTLNLSSVSQFTDVQITVLIAVSELHNVACCAREREHLSFALNRLLTYLFDVIKSALRLHLSCILTTISFR